MAVRNANSGARRRVRLIRSGASVWGSRCRLRRRAIPKGKTQLASMPTAIRVVVAFSNSIFLAPGFLGVAVP
jgi:hypothetical protein